MQLLGQRTGNTLRAGHKLGPSCDLIGPSHFGALPQATTVRTRSSRKVRETLGVTHPVP